MPGRTKQDTTHQNMLVASTMQVAKDDLIDSLYVISHTISTSNIITSIAPIGNNGLASITSIPAGVKNTILPNTIGNNGMLIELDNLLIGQTYKLTFNLNSTNNVNVQLANLIDPSVPTWNIIQNNVALLSNSVQFTAISPNTYIRVMQSNANTSATQEILVSKVRLYEQSFFTQNIVMNAYDERENQDYRYGFGGHEKDNEVSGEGNHLAFGDYGYDTRLGKRWNVDPKFNKIPGWSPYSYGLNNPISVSDPDGEFPVYFMIRRYESSKYFGTPFISKGDARQTSIYVTKSARVHHLIGVETNSPVGSNPVFLNNATSSESRQYTPWSGRGTETPSSSALGDVLTNNNRTSTLNFGYKSSAYEPIAKKFCEACTLAIDTKGSIGVNEIKGKNELQIFGSINGDNFPDAEGFIYDASGNGISLGDFQHSKYGSPMKDLQGEGNSPLINFDITVKTDKKGNFKSASYMQDGKAVPLKVYSQKETNFTAPKQEEKK